MSGDKIELVRGGGNVYRDFGHADAGLEQARAIIAAKILRTLDARKLSTRDAQNATGVSHAEFSRIRNAQLRRFTLDRMIAILGKLDEHVEVSVSFKARRAADAPNAPHHAPRSKAVSSIPGKSAGPSRRALGAGR